MGTPSETTAPDVAPSPRPPTPNPTPAETLAPGRHSTQRWLPYLSFEGRPGWRLVTDSTLQVELSYDGGRARVHAVNDAYPPCPSRPTDEVEDHSAAPGAGTSVTSTLHWIEPAAAIEEVTAAGFALDGQSDVLANPGDPKTAGVRDPSIQGETEKFALRFRKAG